MRILLAVHQFMPEFRAGTETLTFRTAQELQRRGHSVYVLVGGKYDPALPSLHRYNWVDLPVIRLNVQGPTPILCGGLGQTYRRPDLELLLRQVLAEVKPDVVHLFHLRRLTLTLVDLLQTSSIQTVLSITDYWFGCFTGQMQYPTDQPCAGPDPDSSNCLRHLSSRVHPLLGYIPSRFWRFLMRALAAIGFVGPSASLRQLAQRPTAMMTAYASIQRVLVPSIELFNTFHSLGFELSRTRICPYGIDVTGLEGLPPRMPWRGSTERPLKIAFVGTFNHAKGAHVLLDAVAHVHYKDSLSVQLFGSMDEHPAYSKRLKSMASRLSNVSFAGVFSPDDVYSVLSQVDLLIVPSLWRENSPLILLQAMAVGLPVLASDVSGMSSHIRPGINGELFEPGNSKALAALLDHLIAKPEQLTAMTGSLLKPTTIRDYVDQVESVYHELL